VKKDEKRVGGVGPLFKCSRREREFGLDRGFLPHQTRLHMEFLGGRRGLGPLSFKQRGPKKKGKKQTKRPSTTPNAQCETHALVDGLLLGGTGCFALPVERGLSQPRK